LKFISINLYRLTEFSQSFDIAFDSVERHFARFLKGVAFGGEVAA